jgi:hypothetical protein
LPHSVIGGVRTPLQRHNERIGIDMRPRRRNADCPNRTHAAALEHVGKIGRTGEIVRDTARQCL